MLHTRIKNKHKYGRVYLNNQSNYKNQWKNCVMPQAHDDYQDDTTNINNSNNNTIVDDKWKSGHGKK